jgi:DNA-binding GntR family transcriptional regulator
MPVLALGGAVMESFELSEQDPRPYVQLALKLRRQITDGTLTDPDRTPSITTLSQDTGHARQTCSKALRLLVNEGLLVHVPGHGYHTTSR